MHKLFPPLMLLALYWGLAQAQSAAPLSERGIDVPMWAGVLQIGAVMAVVTLLTIDIDLPGGLIEGARDLSSPQR